MRSVRRAADGQVAAQVDRDAHRVEHRGLGLQATVRCGRVRSVHDLDVVGFWKPGRVLLRRYAEHYALPLELVYPDLAALLGRMAHIR